MHKGCIPVCVCVRGFTLSTGNVTVPQCSLSTHGVDGAGFIGFMQCIIRREGRGLCFDRVTAAGGAEFVVVSRRMLSSPAPADGDRIPHPTTRLYKISHNKSPLT